MSSPASKPSLFRVVASDMVASIAVIAPVAMLLVHVATQEFGLTLSRRGSEIGPDGSSFFLIAAVVTAVVGLPIAWLRYQRVARFFTEGARVPGRIESVGFSRDRGRVEFSYDYDGQSYNSGSAIMKNRRTKTLEAGQEVQVLVDPDEPKKAMLADLYQ